jgi:hypothetical protein
MASILEGHERRLAGVAATVAPGPRSWSASGSMNTTNPIEVGDVQVRQHDRFTKERA